MSFISVVPVVGDAAGKGGKVFRFATKNADEFVEAAKKIGKATEVSAEATKLLPAPKIFQNHHIIPAFRGKSKKYADFIASR